MCQGFPTPLPIQRDEMLRANDAFGDAGTG
jgi:hypothetical protein